MDGNGEDGMGREALAREVGRFSFKALAKAAGMVKPGAKLYEVAEAVEGFTRESGFGCAFPLNLSVNGQAAHFSPSFQDEKVFAEGDVVKVDFGAEKNGVLGDCAVTVDLSGRHDELVEAANEALSNAISVVKGGITVGEIGAEIARTITSKGLSPIMNLGGHSVKVHDLHSDVFIPNFDNHDGTALEEGMVVAIEPFVTTGRKAYITEGNAIEIYGFNGMAQVRSPSARVLLAAISSTYSNEPFAARWLAKLAESRFQLYAGMSELVRAGALHTYPVLVAQDDGIIAQAEAEVLVTKGGCEVLTE